MDYISFIQLYISIQFNELIILIKMMFIFNNIFIYIVYSKYVKV